LSAEERVLTFAWTPSGDLVVATPRGLWVPESLAATSATMRAEKVGSPVGEPAGRLLPWEYIVTAKWAGDALTVTSAEEVWPQILRRQQSITLALPEPADLPRVVRQRIDRSVTVSHRRTLDSGSTVLLVGRRVSGRDGLLWYAVFDRDGDADDEQARRQATALLGSAVRAASAPEPD